jgi:uroporphyrinogen decarboxylase
MYLRALCGPEGIMYAFYDVPDVVEAALDSWVDLADKMIRRLQAKAEIDELFFGEDICYKNGLLISPDMWRQFLKPRYLELIKRVQSRQQRKLLIHIDTDGNVKDAIPLYMEIGMNMMSPFEGASGCNVVEIAKQYPELRMYGGIDKRVLATTPKQIDDYLEGIIPFMKQRGGFIPTCDHSVPNEVLLSNYRHYREKIVALGG